MTGANYHLILAPFHMAGCTVPPSRTCPVSLTPHSGPTGVGFLTEMEDPLCRPQSTIGIGAWEHDQRPSLLTSASVIGGGHDEARMTGRGGGDGSDETPRGWDI